MIRRSQGTEWGTRRITTDELMFKNRARVVDEESSQILIFLQTPILGYVEVQT
jgi:hypothetical protein